jgi:Flp pilus assembly protein TadG
MTVMNKRSGPQARRPRGQSLVEFALILPLLLTFLGATVDFARLFHGWITLQSATRAAAESAATNSITSGAALTEARRVVCIQTQNLPGFQAGVGSPPASTESCTAPTVSIVSYARSFTDPGASTRYPIATVSVRTSLPFTTLFPYPFLPKGVWTLSSTQSYSIIQGRL